MSTPAGSCVQPDGVTLISLFVIMMCITLEIDRGSEAYIYMLHSYVNYHLMQLLTDPRRKDITFIIMSILFDVLQIPYLMEQSNPFVFNNGMVFKAGTRCLASVANTAAESRQEESKVLCYDPRNIQYSDYVSCLVRGT